MNGWIKISRGISTHWLWQDAERLKWWLDLLFMASWEDSKQFVGSRLIAVKRGQLVASISYLVKRWGIGHNTVIAFLKMLQEEKMITKSSMRNISIITICNYDKYQAEDNLKNKLNSEISTQYQSTTSRIEDNLKDNLKDTSKEIKKKKNNTSSSSSTNACARNFFDELKADRIWGEAMAMNFNLTSLAELHEWIDKFELDCNCREVTHTDRKDAKRHFNDWLRVKKYSTTTKNQPRTTTSYKPEDEYNRRQAEFAKHIEEQLRTPYREIDVSQIF